MASTSASGSLATARPNARSLRVSAWRVEKAALLSQGGPSRCARSARGAGASRGRTGAVVVEAKIWTDDGRRRAAELMGLTREVRPSPRAARHPRAHLLYFLSRGAFFFFSRLLARPGIRNRRRNISRVSIAFGPTRRRRGGDDDAFFSRQDVREHRILSSRDSRRGRALEHALTRAHARLASRVSTASSLASLASVAGSFRRQTPETRVPQALSAIPPRHRARRGRGGEVPGAAGGLPRARGRRRCLFKRRAPGRRRVVGARRPVGRAVPPRDADRDGGSVSAADHLSSGVPFDDTARSRDARKARLEAQLSAMAAAPTRRKRRVVKPLSTRPAEAAVTFTEAAPAGTRATAPATGARRTRGTKRRSSKATPRRRTAPRSRRGTRARRAGRAGTSPTGTARSRRTSASTRSSPGCTARR